jgi:serine/threonine-protein kinase
MELVAGQSLGRYEITGHLGAGGIGVIFLARFSQLSRGVAVNVLNDQATAKPSRIQRLSHDARAAAARSNNSLYKQHSGQGGWFL